MSPAAVWRSAGMRECVWRRVRVYFASDPASDVLECMDCGSTWLRADGGSRADAYDCPELEEDARRLEQFRAVCEAAGCPEFVRDPRPVRS